MTSLWIRGTGRGTKCVYGATVPPRPRRGRGYIEQLPSGSWRAVVYVGTDPLTGDDVRLRETRPTRSDAERALTGLLRQVDERKIPKSAITVAAAVQQWMEVAELEETTRDRYEDLIRLYRSSWPASAGPSAGQVTAGEEPAV